MHWKAQFEILTISSLRRRLPSTDTLKWLGHNCVQIMCNTLSANHVQHVVLRLSLAEFKSHLF